MAAVIDFHTASAVPHHLPLGEGRPERPRFSVIEGGRSATGLRQRRIYLRRRVVAVAAVLAVLFVGAQIVGAASDLVVGGSAGDVGTAVHRVRPGDSLWAVASTIDPTADPRDVIDRIVELNSTTGSSEADLEFSPDAPLQVGQALVVPARRG